MRNAASSEEGGIPSVGSLRCRWWNRAPWDRWFTDSSTLMPLLIWGFYERGAGTLIAVMYQPIIELLESNQLLAAEALARQLLVQRPRDGFVWKLLCVSLVRQDKPALHELRQAVTMSPNDAELHHNLAIACVHNQLWLDAETHFVKSLAINPQSADVLMDLAEFYKTSERLNEALSTYQKALPYLSDPLPALNESAVCFLSLGKYEEAQKLLKAVIARYPRESALCANLAQSYYLQPNYAAALAEAIRALTINSEESGAKRIQILSLYALQRTSEAFRELDQWRAQASALSLPMIASVYADLNHSERVIECLERLSKVRPLSPSEALQLADAYLLTTQVSVAERWFNDCLLDERCQVPALIGLAKCARLRRDIDLAQRLIGQALAINPTEVDGQLQAGELRAERGEFEEALTYFEAVLQRFPNQASAHFNIAIQTQRGEITARRLRAVLAALAADQSVADQIVLRFTAGKYCDDLGECENALSHIDQAHALRRQGRSPVSRSALLDLKRLTQDRFLQSDGVELKAGLGQKSLDLNPLLIVGMPRSGTSLLEQMLASHSMIDGAGELNFWPEAAASVAPMDPSSGSYTVQLESIRQRYETLHQAYAPLQRWLIDKRPTNFWHLGLVTKVFPNARILHITRERHDTCWSIYQQNFNALGGFADDWGDLNFYYDVYEDLMAFWESQLPPILKIPYEGLVEDPQPWLERLCDWIGVGFEPNLLSYGHQPRVVQTASRWQARQPVYRQAMGRAEPYRALLQKRQ